MARRRYLSTDISTDKVVNRLAMEAGDFAALLYTWMIPHAGDDATVEGDPEELLMVAMPGRRDKQPEDVANALAAMDERGLIVWDRNAGVVRFPPSFYTHQSYITESRRNSPVCAEGGANRHSAPTPPQNSADQRTAPQNAASLKVSSSFSSSSSVPLTPSGGNDGGEQTQADRQTTKAAPLPSSMPYRLFQVLCEETGVDEADASPGLKKQQCGIASQILADGFDEEDVRRCVRYLRSQSWRTAAIDLKTVKAEIGKWRLSGRPEIEPPRIVANGRSPTRTEEAGARLAKALAIAEGPP